MYRIRNWAKFQHYKDRNPPWIKLHYELLSSRDWVALADASRVVAIACMLVASRNDGYIDGSQGGLQYLKRVAYLNTLPNLNPLIDCGFLECASAMLADASGMHANARPETETETETETEKATGHRADDPGAFESKFWPAYPRKVAKASAAKAFAKINPDDALLGRMLAALERERRSDQWQREDGRFIPHAATWLNQRRWEDEAQPTNEFDPASFADGAVL